MQNWLMEIFVVHWQEDELAEIRARLQSPGMNLRGHWSQGEKAEIINPWPDVLVVSLDRLPSHGWAIAEWMWSAKSRRHIPIYFVGGKPEKIEATKAKFSDAVFCNWGELPQLLKVK